MLPAIDPDRVYNIFGFLNMNNPDSSNAHQEIARFLQSIDQPARLEILQTIGSGEACVCHLETALGYRQPYISQHLMALREAGIITARREGRYVFYTLCDVSLLELINSIAELAGIQDKNIMADLSVSSLRACPCPHCQEE